VAALAPGGRFEPASTVGSLRYVDSRAEPPGAAGSLERFGMKAGTFRVRRLLPAVALAAIAVVWVPLSGAAQIR
jgi:hypothetical protein